MRSATLVVTFALAALALVAAPAAAEVVQSEDGRLLAPVPLVGLGSEDRVDEHLPYDGVDYDEVPLVAEAQGADFELEAIDEWGMIEEADLDVCFYDEAGDRLGCAATPGTEEGTVPAQASTAGIFLYSGHDVTYRFTAFTS